MNCRHQSSLRQSALLIAPIAPAPTGNGLALRAGVTVQGLARAYNLTVAIIPISSGHVDKASHSWLAHYAYQIYVASFPDPVEIAKSWLASAQSRAALAAAEPLAARLRNICPNSLPAQLTEKAFDLVWVMRSYTAIAALPFRNTDAQLILDLDENDSRVLSAIAAIHDDLGATEAARANRQEAAGLARWLKHCTNWFDTVVTASDAETAQMLGSDVDRPTLTTIQNAAPGAARATTRSATVCAHSGSCLFVGNMTYAPNADAVRRLVSNIMPMVRRRRPAATLDIAGHGAIGDWVNTADGVTFHGFVEDLFDLYSQADIFVAPLRAGGGSRIKLLEAFMCAVPVVASPSAASGLDVNHLEHLLVADEDSSIADFIVMLIDDPQLAAALSRRALSFVKQHHDVEIVAQRVAEVAQGLTLTQSSKPTIGCTL
ncbi:MAG: glycosyltransferase [Hyphomicrobiaceae bacterium]